MPSRIQRQRTKGWRLADHSDNAVIVSRPTKWGNPYRAIRGTVYGPARPVEGGELVAFSTFAPARDAVAAAVEYYRRDIDCGIRSWLTTAMIRDALAGKDLVCWCPLDQPCHGDVLLQIAAEAAHA